MNLVSDPNPQGYYREVGSSEERARIVATMLEIHMGRGAEFHGVITAEHQVMGFEGTLRDRLTNFSRLTREVMPNAFSVDTKERLSPVYIRDRASNPYGEVLLFLFLQEQIKDIIIIINPYGEVKLK
jgi:hypothetical protein